MSDTSVEIPVDLSSLVRGRPYRIVCQFDRNFPGRYIEGLYRGKVRFREVVHLAFESTMMVHLCDPDYIVECEYAPKRWSL